MTDSAHLPRSVAITGATGLIGTALTARLRAAGVTVRPLTRSADGPEGSIPWDPLGQGVDPSRLAEVESIVHLAGAPVAQRWTQRHKVAIQRSRTEGTAALARSLAAASPMPKTLVSASAIGIYGDRGDERLDERSARGEGFLADVATAWEEAADPARDAGVRVVHPRIGIVLAKEGGALAKMLTPFKFGVGGRLGHGRQWMSWIALEDLVEILVAALAGRTPKGPINAVAPNPVTNREFTKTLGKVLRRPTILPAPAFALRLVLGEMSEILLNGQRVHPAALQAAGFEFRHPDLEGALRAILG